jgi:hypothetical protein
VSALSRLSGAQPSTLVPAPSLQPKLLTPAPSPQSPAPQDSGNYFRVTRRTRLKAQFKTEKLYRFNTNVLFCNNQKRWAELGASVRLTSRSARDVRKTPSLRASVGGGQISLTSVLIGGFVTCCCASSPYRPLLSVPAPSLESSVHQKVPSGDATYRCKAGARKRRWVNKCWQFGGQP